MIAICPVGSPKLILPSRNQQRNASRKEGAQRRRSSLLCGVQHFEDRHAAIEGVRVVTGDTS